MTSLLLTLTAPVALEEQLTGLLSAHEPSSRAGFRISDVRCHGDNVAYRDVFEQIRGYVRMIEVAVVLAERDMAELLGLLAKELPFAEISYRATPIVRAGRLNAT